MRSGKNIIKSCFLSLMFSSSVSLLSACGDVSDGRDTPQSEMNAIIPPQQASQAFNIVRGINYLPFFYKNDGCYARAFYINMELAAAGIPSSLLYQIGNLQPPGAPGVKWTWHVAPLIKDTARMYPWIIDPSLANGPVIPEAWFRLSGNYDQYVKYAISNGGFENSNWAFSNQRVADRRYLPTQQDYQYMIKSYSSLYPFAVSRINYECSMAFLYLGDNNPALRQRLITRTRELMGWLNYRGKLYNDAAFTCRR
ncbi:MAG: hypothetical protein HQK54_12430 [Oligoflexales bacterium]|nr:hypothetical protein [Oligoflexales bacterium]